jgi:hypothetical protein
LGLSKIEEMPEFAKAKEEIEGFKNAQKSVEEKEEVSEDETQED